MEQIQKALQAVVLAEFGVENFTAVIERPEAEFGDFATNCAMQLAGRLKRNPKDIAATICQALPAQDTAIESVDLAGPGFINIRMSASYWRAQIDNILAQKTEYGNSGRYNNQVVVAEYSDPNPFKVLHAGHLYTSLVGDVIARLFEAAGATVKRVNFGGDVGLHVAKSMWAIVQHLGGEFPEALDAVPSGERTVWLSARYVEGNQAYETDERAKEAIIDINARVYALHESGDTASPFAQIYWQARQWSYDYFHTIYEQLGMVPFDAYYPESVTTPIGMAAVREGLEKNIFENSQGAVVYRGEQDGLHTRVFINSNGLPTYETKDLGLALSKWRDYTFDQSFMITANDIVEYMKVVMAVLRRFKPEIAERTHHLTHGMVKLAGGVKMSSRLGNILLAEDVLSAATAAYQRVAQQDDPAVVLGAVRYAFLRSRIGSDIVYDPAESVSLLGNSGPYLQYAHARACSILRKADYSGASVTLPSEPINDERSLAVKLAAYPDALAQAVDNLAPHYLCTYLYELAQTFNRFYEHNRVADDARASVRLPLVAAYVQILKNGLSLLGIAAPEQM